MSDVIEHIGSTELRRRTGATHRQIDYWCGGNVLPTITRANPGSGNPREFKAEIVPAVKLLVNVSRTFHHSIHKETLKKIFDNYENGFVLFDNGLELCWDVE